MSPSSSHSSISSSPFSLLSSTLLLAILSLFGVGLVQVYSSSYIYATETQGDGLFFFKRQLVFTGLSLALMVMTIYIPLRVWERISLPLWIGLIAFLGLTLLPGLGVRVGGASRWIQIPGVHGGLRVEPSEFIKAGFCLLLARLVKDRKSTQPKISWKWLLLLLGLPLGVLFHQPDFGSFSILLFVGFLVIFCYGLRWRYILVGAALILPIFYALLMQADYRKSRILAFLDPWKDPEQKGFQVIQSMLSFHSGGLTGVGIGQGQGKLFFLPEAHTDFTLAVLGEEMGFLGFLVVLMVYGFICLRGFQMAIRAQDYFVRALALSLSLIFAVCTTVNMGVSLGLLPAKGLTLPFLSYGGSSLLMTGFLMGLLLNIERTLSTEIETT